MAPAETADHKAEVSLDWLSRLRWGAVAGQAAAIALALYAFHARLPLQRLAVLVGALLASNAVLVWVRRRVGLPGRLCGAALTFDALQLTGLLWATGGAANPFSVLYLVYITLAAVVLGARWTWFLAALCVSCYGLLFVTQVPIEHLSYGQGGMQLHLQGMWLAFCVAAGLTAYFVVQMSTAIERRDAEVAAMRDRAARYERLASLVTLAAGAAHELGTPLATIAVVAKELERSIAGVPGARAPALAEDAALIRSELDRCRAILDRMAGSAGQVPGEAPSLFPVHGLIAEVVSAVPEEKQPLVSTSVAGQEEVCAPRAAVLQVIRNLLRNALDAGARHVSITMEAGVGGLAVLVCDDGKGMPPETLARVGEPFFTTKGPGAGLGLGVFLARSLCEQMGGRLTLESTLAVGTTARVEIPAGAPGGAEGWQ
ncbi:MAG TPA: ATP-binding protein [Vicinamibacteria bacterium]|nr:ATP-binding protein [Vicinamibacteria bacterium]